MRRLDELLKRASCGALLVLARSSHDPFLAPFASPARLGASFLIAPLGAPPRLGFLAPMEREEAAATGLELLDPQALDVERWARGGASRGELLADAVSRGLQLSELAPGRLALAGCESAGVTHEVCDRLGREGWSFRPGEEIVAELRRCKTPAQLAAVRRSAAGAGEALRRVAELLAAARDLSGELWLEGERLTVGRLRQAIARVLAGHGLEQPDGNIVAPGAEGAVPHTTGDDARVLAPGESLIVDLYPKGDLFADVTRTFCVGEPPEALRRAHAHVARALGIAQREARPGVRGWALQERVCERFADAGYPTPISHQGTTRGYVHGLGHGVGFEVHEVPFFVAEAGDEGVLEAGDVITLEPGLYDPEAGWAVRIEDLYSVVDDGVDCLTPLPVALDPRAW